MALRKVESWSLQEGRSNTQLQRRWDAGAGRIDPLGGRYFGGGLDGIFNSAEQGFEILSGQTELTITTNWMIQRYAYFGPAIHLYGPSPNLRDGGATVLLSRLRIVFGETVGTFQIEYEGYSPKIATDVDNPFAWSNRFYSDEITIDGDVQLDKWYQLELRFDWSSGNLRVKMRIDTVEVFDDEPTFSSGDLSGSLYATSPNLVQAIMGFYRYSDTVISDNTTQTWDADHTEWLGFTIVKAFRPKADGTYLMWSPDTGTEHFSRVNETVEDFDDTYIATDTVDDIDTFLFRKVVGFNTINAVHLAVFANSPASNARQIKGYIVSGAYEGESEAFAILTKMKTIYKGSGFIFVRNPDGDVVWTPDSLKLAEFGPKLIA